MFPNMHVYLILEGVMLMIMYIVPTMLTELLYPLQYGYTPLHLAAQGGHTTCVDFLHSTPGINANVQDEVNWSTEYKNKISTVIGTVADIASHYTFQMINMQHYIAASAPWYTYLFNHYQMVDTKLSV